MKWLHGKVSNRPQLYQPFLNTHFIRVATKVMRPLCCKYIYLFWYHNMPGVKWNQFLPFFAPFSTFFWIWFLDFFSFLLFSARHPFRFFRFWHEHDFKCVTSSSMMMCVPPDTFLKCNPENDPNWPSNPDLGTESFCPFLVLMLLMVFFVLYVLLCRFSHEIFKTHRKHL